MSIRFDDHMEGGVPGAEGGWSVRGGRTYKVSVRVTTSSRLIGPRAILQASGLRYGDYYRWPITGNQAGVAEQDFGSFLQDISITPVGVGPNECYWKMSLNYTPFDVNHEGGTPAADGVLSPFSAPPQVTWTSARLERTWPFDANNQPYINTAGDPIDDPPKTPDSNPILTIVRNENSYNPLLVSQFKNRTNSGQWLIFPDNTVRVNDITARRQYQADFGTWFEVTYEFEIQPDTWAVKVLNRGLREKVSGNRKQILVDGAPISDPVLLDSTGARTFTPYYLTFQPHLKVDFTPLNIPPTIFDSGI